MIEARFVIVGGGLAGASTAYHLARRGRGPVVVLDREPVAGTHSSGRNAAMVRQVVSDPAIARLAAEGARAIRSMAAGQGTVGFREGGSFLLASGPRAETLERESAEARGRGIETRALTPGEAAARVPPLAGADFETCCSCPSDGVVEIAALLDHYLRGARDAGARVQLGAEASEVIVEGGRVAGVRAVDLVVRAPVVVNAAGAWAGVFARKAGAAEVPLRPMRRHLMFSGRFAPASPSWPFVWDVSHEVYFRPEADGLLLSPCDIVEAAPGIPDTDPGALDLLHQKVARHLPGLGDFPVARCWAGLRTLTPDGRFVIGPDPKLEGFFWVAGLGGHGVTTSHAVGALAADMIERPERDAENPFSPGRFAASAQL
jgi:D-arginine dehydrogenase